MKKIKINRGVIVGVVLVMVIVGFISLTVLYKNLQKKYDSQTERLQHQEMIIEKVQDIEIQRLIEHVRKMMQGEIIYEIGTNVLATYSNNVTRDRLGSDLYSIVTDLRIIDLQLDEN